MGPVKRGWCGSWVSVLLLLGVPAPAWAESSGADCAIWQLRSVSPTASSILTRVQLPEGAATKVDKLPYEVDGLGYAPSQDSSYGIAGRGRGGLFPSRGHVLILDGDGRVSDLGPVRHPHRGWPISGTVDHPSAGAVSGTHWYLRQDDRLYTVDIDAGGSEYLTVVGEAPLHGTGVFALPRDFDIDPVDGLLYGVSASLRGTEVVSIEPVSGRVRSVATVALPEGDYGAVVLGPDRSLYVTVNRLGTRSTLYRVAPDGEVTEISSAEPMTSSDAAGCLADTPSLPPEPPPARPPESPPARPPEPPAPRPSEPPAIPAEPPEPALPPPSASPVPVPTPPMPVPESGKRTHPKEPERVSDSETRMHTTEEKRRWSLAVLLITLGAGAAMRRLRRH